MMTQWNKRFLSLVFTFLSFFMWVQASTLPQLSPQSPEAWHHLKSQGLEHAPNIYTVTEQGLICEHQHEVPVRRIIEALAQENQVHPAYIAEGLATYLWSDWTLFYVSDQNVNNLVNDSINPDEFQDFLEQVYIEHHTCLFAILRVLVFGYEGQYSLEDSGSYTYHSHKTEHSYELLALDPGIFPGTGIFEPLGLVHALKLADLFSINWLRDIAFEQLTSSFEYRASLGENPLTLNP